MTISRRDFLKLCGGLFGAALIPGLEASPFAAARVRYFARGDPSQPYISLTFDDGWDDGLVLQAMQQLAYLNIPASFFPVGKSLLKFAATWQQALEQGFELFNHTFGHDNLGDLSEGEIMKSVGRWEAAYEGLDWGAYTNRLVRCPKNRGVDDAKLYNALFSLGYCGVAGWTIDSGGYIDGSSAESIVSHVKSELEPGAIILCHFVPADIQALPGIYAAAVEQGLAFVPLSRLPGTPIYHAEEQVVPKVKRPRRCFPPGVLMD